MAVQLRKSLTIFLMAATSSGVLVTGASAQQDPPTRVGRVSYTFGNASMQPAGLDDWSVAVVNRPLTTGDNLWSDAGSTIEVRLNNAAIRLGSETSAGFLNLDDHFAQLRFTQGEMLLTVRRMRDDDSFEVDTPNAAVTILREGEYRFNADPNAATSFVAVRHGEAEVTGGGQAFTLRAGNSTDLSGTDQLTYDVAYLPDVDRLETWAEDRDAKDANRPSSRYLPPDVLGYEELDAYGSWRSDSNYGNVWYPRVGADWAPYHDGHFAWIEPWGWTWVDDAPWGFAPSHYGRWAYIGGGWGWVPGPLLVGGGAVVTPIYAPALVAFFGGGGFGASLSIGGPAVGWVALGPGDVYTPAFAVSRTYFSSINSSNTRIVNNVNITNVYNNVYVNKSVTVTNVKYVNMAAPNAVTAMSQNAFASGGSVKTAGVAIKGNDLAKVQSAPVAVAPPVAPARQAVAPKAGSKPAAAPPARTVSMQVVAKKTPPPAAVPFASQQAALQQNVGHPVNMQAVKAAAPARPAPAAAVRVAPPARTVTPPAATHAPAPRPAQAAPGGQPAPAPRPSQPAPAPAPAPRPAQPAPAPAPRPGQPAPATRPSEPAPTPRPAQPATRPSEPAPTPRPAQPATRPPEAAPRPAQPATRPPEAAPRPAEPAPRPSEAAPRPAQPAPRPPEAAPRPAQPAPRPPEAARPAQPAPAPARPPQKPPQKPKPENEKEKEKKE